MLSIQRLLMIGRLEPEVGGTYKPQPTSVEHSGHLEFNQVSMSYKKDLKPALQNVSFTLEPGEQIAVVGRTGAGKSSLLQLLFGFRKASQGSVLLNSHAIADYDLHALRKELNVVLQHPFVIP